MNTAQAFALSIVPLLLAAVFLLVPMVNRGQQLFSIPVSTEFLQSAEAARLRRIYRAVVATAGALAMVGMLRSASRDAGQEPDWQMAIVPLAKLVGLACCWGWAWNATMPHRVAHPVVRTASLRQQEPSGAVWWLSTLPALLPLLLAAACLQLKWAQIPATFATHFDMSGVPNGYEQKSLAGVFLPVVMGCVLVGMMAVLGWAVARFSPAGPSPVLRRVTMNLLRVLCWFCSLLLCFVALLPLQQHVTSMTAWMVFAAVAAMLCVVACMIVGIVRDKGFDNLPEATSERYWKWGLFYFNPNDGALLVPKRMGFGYTFNFARPAAWLMMGALVAIVVVPLALGRHMHLVSR